MIASRQRLDQFRDSYDKGRGLIMQAMWFAASNLLFRRWWFPARLRPSLLRMFGAEVGKGVLIRHDVRIHWPWKLRLGHSVWIGEGAWFLNLAPIVIGDNVCISQESVLCTGGHNPRDEAFGFANIEIVIESGAWLGLRSIIKPGSHIGRDACIAAGMVAPRIVPSNVVLRSATDTQVTVERFDNSQHGKAVEKVMRTRPAEYEWRGAAPAHSHASLTPAVLRVLSQARGRRVLDLGCGNGSLTAELSNAGMKVTGIDVSVSGIDAANAAYPGIDWVQHDLTHPLPGELSGRFDYVLAAEVIEHLFLPRTLFERATEALGSSGVLVVTTPYHGYAKNLALAISGKFDRHWSPGWDFGHIKFFSRRSLYDMAIECGYQPYAWKLVGRIKPIAKTMIMQARLNG